MTFKEYENEESIEIGDVVCHKSWIDVPGYYPFPSSIVTKIEGNVTYLSRPYISSDGTGCEEYSAFRESIKRSFRYYVTGPSGAKYNIYK